MSEILKMRLRGQQGIIDVLVQRKRKGHMRAKDAKRK
jgi:hypothetical protein